MYQIPELSKTSKIMKSELHFIVKEGWQMCEDSNDMVSVPHEARFFPYIDNETSVKNRFFNMPFFHMNVSIQSKESEKTIEMNDLKLSFYVMNENALEDLGGLFVFTKLLLVSFEKWAKNINRNFAVVKAEKQSIPIIIDALLERNFNIRSFGDKIRGVKEVGD